MTFTPAALLPYVSASVVRRLAADPASALRSDLEDVPVAALFADVADSTRMVEALAEKGREGAERFSALLDVYLTVLIDTVKLSGGEVFKFEGDAVLAIWRARDDGDLPRAAHEAAACAQAFQLRVLAVPTGSDGRLTLRAGVGAGAASIVHVSDGVHRSEMFMIGPALAETLAAAKAAERGGVAIGARARGFSQRFAGRNDAPAKERSQGASRPVPLEGADAVAALAHYVPEAVRLRSAGERSEWLAELRTVTTVFVGLGLDGIRVNPEFFDAVAVVMRHIERCGGDIARVGAQRDGVALLAAFGLPPHAHDDDADRAARAAMMLREELAGRGIEVSVGITTGRSICGPVGSARRREYTMIGDAVNVAARLMNAAGGAVLCDAETRQASRGRVRFGQPRVLAPRGRKSAVEVFEPVGYGQVRAATGVEMVGRREERAQLTEALHALEKDGHGAAFVVEGEAGIGKSRLAAFVADSARALGLQVVTGGAEPTEMQRPFHAWRRVVVALLDAPAEAGDNRRTLAGGQLAQVQALLVQRCGMGEAHAQRMAPLLGAVLGTPFEENVWTAQLSPQARVEQTIALVVRILIGGAARPDADATPAQRQAPLVVVLEDAHWFDAPSWSALRMAVQEGSSIVIVVTSRPNRSSEYGALLAAPNVHHLVLTGLAVDDVRTLAAGKLTVRSVPSPLVQFLFERGLGHPFFTEELLEALRRAGALLLYGGECRLPPQDLERLSLPRTVEGIVAARIDALGESASSLLKIGAVLGSTFTAADLAGIDPAHRAHSEVTSELNGLVRGGLLEAVPERDACFTFHHAIVQTVAYETVTYAQRRRLHRAAAESLSARDHTPAALLAYHWSRAVDRQNPAVEALEKAIDATEAAGEEAMRSFDNGAAIALFSDALDLARPVPGIADASRRAHWYRCVGEASFRAGLPDAAKRNLLTALELLDCPMPSSTAAVRAALLGGFLHQVLHRALPDKLITGGARRDPARIARLRQEAATGGLLSFVMMLMGESEAPVLANLRALNASDHAGPCAELAASAVSFSLTAGMALGARVETFYFDRARRVAEGVGDLNALARIWWMRGFYLLSRARWDDAWEVLDRSRAIYEEVGDSRGHETAVMAIGNVFTLSYRFEAAREAYMRGYGSAHARGDVQGEAWSHIGLSQGTLLLGRHREALALLSRIEAWMGGDLRNIGDRASELAVLGMRATVLNHENDLDGAREVLRAAHARLGKPIFLYHAVTGYTFLADASMRLLEAAQQAQARSCPAYVRPRRSQAVDSEVERMAFDFERALWRFGRVMPIGRAQARVWRGLRRWLEGRPRRARRAWDRAAAVAAALNMPYDEALAHYEAGRHLPPGDARRRRRLQQARELFVRIGAAHWVRRVDAELEQADAGAQPQPPLQKRPRYFFFG